MTFDDSSLQVIRERRLLIDQYDAWLFPLIEPFIGRRVLEVGCGLGNLTRHLLDWELLVRIDISEASLAHVNLICGHHPNVHAMACDVTSSTLLSSVPHRFDTVVSLNVLGYLADDILALEWICEVLGASGWLILIVPAHPCLYGTMDRSIGHLRRYSRRELRCKLRQARLEVRTQRYVNAIGALGWLVHGRILRREFPPVAQLRVFYGSKCPLGCRSYPSRSESTNGFRHGVIQVLVRDP